MLMIQIYPGPTFNLARGPIVEEEEERHATLAEGVGLVWVSSCFTQYKHWGVDK